MSYLLDTNIICELRRGAKCHPNVRAWAARNMDVGHYVSVITLGEIRNGIELKRLKDPARASQIEADLIQLKAEYADALLPLNEAAADIWGKLNSPQTLPTADSMIAATALVHGLTVATRNEDDFIRCGVSVVNPFK
ncbi:MAG: type II toxin-antitoxin system VapC family toxin [Prosthecobacter sp.]|uniref:type II toxin-antitoxin system VapC family toxin n=1 Tax=Prosthecobacter sp. TaxID=1965333 RepID=UPI00390019BC